MDIWVASTNPAKIRQLSGVLASFRVRSLDPATLPFVAEDGTDAVSIARTKALAFAAATGRVCLSMDAVLQLPTLPASQQPGLHVRELPGLPGVATDEQVLDHYVALCLSHGGSLLARWTFGYAIANPDGRCHDCAIHAERLMVTPPTTRRRPGYPLDSLLRDPATGRYLAELSGPDEEKLWQATIGTPLQEFVRTVSF